MPAASSSPGTHIGIHVEPLKDAKDAAKEAKPQ